MTTFNPQQLAARKGKGNQSAKPLATKPAQPLAETTTDPALSAEPATEQENPPGDPQAGAEPPAATNKTPGLPGPDASSVTLEIPIGAMQTGFCTPRVDFKATPRQAAAAKMLWCTLSNRGERFSGGSSSNSEGTVVDNVNGGLRWLLDQLADAIEAETGLDLTRDYDQVFR